MRIVKNKFTDDNYSLFVPKEIWEEFGRKKKEFKRDFPVEVAGEKIRHFALRMNL